MPLWGPSQWQTILFERLHLRMNITLCNIFQPISGFFSEHSVCECLQHMNQTILHFFLMIDYLVISLSQHVNCPNFSISHASFKAVSLNAECSCQHLFAPHCMVDSFEWSTNEVMVILVSWLHHVDCWWSPLQGYIVLIPKGMRWGNGCSFDASCEVNAAQPMPLKLHDVHLPSRKKNGALVRHHDAFYLCNPIQDKSTCNTRCWSL